MVRLTSDLATEIAKVLNKKQELVTREELMGLEMKNLDSDERVMMPVLSQFPEGADLDNIFKVKVSNKKKIYLFTSGNQIEMAWVVAYHSSKK